MMKIEKLLIILWPVKAIRSTVRLDKIIPLTSDLHILILLNDNAFLNKELKVHHKEEIWHQQDNTTHLG